MPRPALILRLPEYRSASQRIGPLNPRSRSRRTVFSGEAPVRTRPAPVCSAMSRIDTTAADRHWINSRPRNASSEWSIL
ncbi:hypothetical protein AMK34_01750 [Amycolatopsis sp. CB00013]|nr:hypothetical protein AMK34_01750 [Amycolatopsis sp. CB00013]